MKPIKCKWVCKIKFNLDSTVEHHKARLVAKGYNQVEGLDYLETFAPVAKLVAICLLQVVASFFINLMSIMPSYMLILMKMCTCLYLLVSNERVGHEFASFTNHYMILNKSLINGLSNFPLPLNKPITSNQRLTTPCSSDPKTVNSLFSSFM